MTIGGLGFLLTVVVSSWISFKGSSWLWINIIWTSTIIWLILSGIFQRTTLPELKVFSQNNQEKKGLCGLKIMGKLSYF